MAKCRCKECTARPECKKLIMRFFAESDWLPMCSENCRLTVDWHLADWMIKNGGKEFLSQDVTAGYQVGGVSELVLCSLQGKTIRGKAGIFKIEPTYGMHSVRSFELWPVAKGKK